MIILEALNRPNQNNGNQNGRKHHMQMIFFIEDKALCNQTRKLSKSTYIQNGRHEQSGMKIV